MSDNTQITVTIKFNGVTLENVTIEQARELRDKLNQVLGERVVERREYVPHYPYYPPYRPYEWWCDQGTTGRLNLTSSNTLSIDNTADADSSATYISDDDLVTPTIDATGITARVEA